MALQHAALPSASPAARSREINGFNEDHLMLCIIKAICKYEPVFLSVSLLRHMHKMTQFLVFIAWLKNVSGNTSPPLLKLFFNPAVHTNVPK